MNNPQKEEKGMENSNVMIELDEGSNIAEKMSPAETSSQGSERRQESGEQDQDHPDLGSPPTNFLTISNNALKSLIKKTNRELHNASKLSSNDLYSLSKDSNFPAHLSTHLRFVDQSSKMEHTIGRNGDHFSSLYHQNEQKEDESLVYGLKSAQKKRKRVGVEPSESGIERSEDTNQSGNRGTWYQEIEFSLTGDPNTHRTASIRLDELSQGTFTQRLQNGSIKNEIDGVVDKLYSSNHQNLLRSQIEAASAVDGDLGNSNRNDLVKYGFSQTSVLPKINRDLLLRQDGSQDHPFSNQPEPEKNSSSQRGFGGDLAVDDLVVDERDFDENPKIRIIQKLNTSHFDGDGSGSKHSQPGHHLLERENNNNQQIDIARNLGAIVMTKDRYSHSHATRTEELTEELILNTESKKPGVPEEPNSGQVQIDLSSDGEKVSVFGLKPDNMAKSQPPHHPQPHESPLNDSNRPSNPSYIITENSRKSEEICHVPEETLLLQPSYANIELQESLEDQESSVSLKKNLLGYLPSPETSKNLISRFSKTEETSQVFIEARNNIAQAKGIIDSVKLRLGGIDSFFKETILSNKDNILEARTKAEGSGEMKHDSIGHIEEEESGFSESPYQSPDPHHQAVGEEKSFQNDSSPLILEEGEEDEEEDHEESSFSDQKGPNGSRDLASGLGSPNQDQSEFNANKEHRFEGEDQLLKDTTGAVLNEQNQQKVEGKQAGASSNKKKAKTVKMDEYAESGTFDPLESITNNSSVPSSSILLRIQQNLMDNGSELKNGLKNQNHDTTDLELDSSSNALARIKDTSQVTMRGIPNTSEESSSLKLALAKSDPKQDFFGSDSHQAAQTGDQSFLKKHREALGSDSIKIDEFFISGNSESKEELRGSEAQNVAKERGNHAKIPRMQTFGDVLSNLKIQDQAKEKADFLAESRSADDPRQLKFVQRHGISDFNEALMHYPKNPSIGNYGIGMVPRMKTPAKGDQLEQKSSSNHPKPSPNTLIHQIEKNHENVQKMPNPELSLPPKARTHQNIRPGQSAVSHTAKNHSDLRSSTKTQNSKGLKKSVLSRPNGFEEQFRSYNILMEDTQTIKPSETDYAWDMSKDQISINSGLSPMPIVSQVSQISKMTSVLTVNHKGGLKKSQISTIFKDDPKPAKKAKSRNNSCFKAASGLGNQTNQTEDGCGPQELISLSSFVDNTIGEFRRPARFQRSEVEAETQPEIAKNQNFLSSLVDANNNFLESNLTEELNGRNNRANSALQVSDLVTNEPHIDQNYHQGQESNFPPRVLASRLKIQRTASLDHNEYPGRSLEKYKPTGAKIDQKITKIKRNRIIGITESSVENSHKTASIPRQRDSDSTWNSKNERIRIEPTESNIRLYEYSEPDNHSQYPSSSRGSRGIIVIKGQGSAQTFGASLANSNNNKNNKTEYRPSEMEQSPKLTFRSSSTKRADRLIKIESRGGLIGDCIRRLLARLPLTEESNRVVSYNQNNNNSALLATQPRSDSLKSGIDLQAVIETNIVNLEGRLNSLQPPRIDAFAGSSSAVRTTEEQSGDEFESSGGKRVRLLVRNAMMRGQGHENGEDGGQEARFGEGADTSITERASSEEARIVNNLYQMQRLDDSNLKFSGLHQPKTSPIERNSPHFPGSSLDFQPQKDSQERFEHGVADFRLQVDLKDAFNSNETEIEGEGAQSRSNGENWPNDFKSRTSQTLLLDGGYELPPEILDTSSNKENYEEEVSISRIRHFSEFETYTDRSNSTTPNTSRNLKGDDPEVVQFDSKVKAEYGFLKKVKNNLGPDFSSFRDKNAIVKVSHNFKKHATDIDVSSANQNHLQGFFNHIIGQKPTVSSIAFKSAESPSYASKVSKNRGKIEKIEKFPHEKFIQKNLKKRGKYDSSARMRSNQCFIRQGKQMVILKKPKRGSVSGTRETQNESRQGEMNLSDLGIIKWAYFENEQNPQLEAKLSQDGKSLHLKTKRPKLANLYKKSQQFLEIYERGRIWQTEKNEKVDRLKKSLQRSQRRSTREAKKKRKKSKVGKRGNAQNWRRRISAGRVKDKQKKPASIRSGNQKHRRSSFLSKEGDEFLQAERTSKRITNRTNETFLPL